MESPVGAQLNIRTPPLPASIRSECSSSEASLPVGRLVQASTAAVRTRLKWLCLTQQIVFHNISPIPQFSHSFHSLFRNVPWALRVPWLVLLLTWHTWEEGTSVEKVRCSYWPVHMSVEHFLIVHWCRGACQLWAEPSLSRWAWDVFERQLNVSSGASH